MSPAAARYDVAIVGGGMVGASLALALCGTGLKVLLIEAIAPGSASQPSFDDRTTALGNGARAIFTTLGVWERISARAGAIRAIHVSDAGRFGFARLSAAEHGQEAFGYTLSNRTIGAVLWEALRGAGRIELACPALVLEVRLQDDAAHLRLRSAAGSERTATAGLVVAADGAHSLIKQAAGIESTTTDYGQVALVVHARTDRRADGTAYERFTASGPIALLPLFEGHYAAVWTLEPAAALAMQQCPAPQFIERLQQAFGWRAGRILEIGARAAYPLKLVRARQAHAVRAVLIGNAAQALHPVAAQGFNLGLRDAAVLAELIARAPDPGAPALLAEFARRRTADRSGMVGFTDRLVQTFSDPRAGMVLARNLGLLLFDVTPAAKRALSRLSFGFGGQLPRLVRGLPL